MLKRVGARSLAAVHAQVQQEFRFAVIHEIHGNEINFQTMAGEGQRKKTKPGA
jgi:hypothetical protein